MSLICVHKHALCICCSLFLVDTEVVQCYEIGIINIKIIKGAKINGLELANSQANVLYLKVDGACALISLL